jgi:hypothetical protein
MKKKQQFSIALLTIFALITGIGVYASSTLTLNSGGDVSLGAGSQRVTTCDNDVFVDPPGLTFDTATQKYMITTISVSQVSQKNPSGCGNWIMELAAGYQGGYQMTSWSIPSSAVDSTFYFGGTKSGSGMAKTILSAIDPTLIQNIAIQMYPAKSCADGGVCTVGDIGPGGGKVFYVSATSFTEPVSGKTFKYIEAAPAYWLSGVIDPKTGICNNYSIPGALPNTIGYAKSNTDTILADSNCRGTSAISGTIPSGTQLAGSLSRNLGSDWNIPTYDELDEMCKVERFGIAVAPTKTHCDDADQTGASTPTNWLTVNYSSSSKPSTAGYASVVNIRTGYRNTLGLQNNGYGIRPVRYF